jgi:hypothetical protein
MRNLNFNLIPPRFDYVLRRICAVMVLGYAGFLLFCLEDLAS